MQGTKVGSTTGGERIKQIHRCCAFVKLTFPGRHLGWPKVGHCPTKDLKEKWNRVVHFSQAFEVVQGKPGGATWTGHAGCRHGVRQDWSLQAEWFGVLGQSQIGQFMPNRIEFWETSRVLSKGYTRGRPR